MDRTTLTILALAIVATTAPAADGTATAGRRLTRVANGAQHATGQQLDIQARRLDRLIDDLESGRPVDPLEVDRVLSEAGV
jgi:hypothetical protein